MCIIYIEKLIIIYFHISCNNNAHYIVCFTKQNINFRKAKYFTFLQSLLFTNGLSNQKNIFCEY